VVDKGKLRRKRLGITDAELLREVDVMRKLRHDNLVALREVIDDGNKQLYMVQVRRNEGERDAPCL
jgi:serine/threonine protein kinase